MLSELNESQHNFLSTQLQRLGFVSFGGLAVVQQAVPH